MDWACRRTLRRGWFFIAVVGLFVTLASTAAEARMVPANPANVTAQLSRLQPGDTLVLAPGVYKPLYLANLHGTPQAWITVMGAESPEGEQAAIIANQGCCKGDNCCDTVGIYKSTYLAIKKLRIDGMGNGSNGIVATGGLKNLVHDILIEGNLLVNLSHDQQDDGISTKTPTWNWTIRRNKIFGAGTALYLGNSDGTDPFVAGVIENNLIQDPVGYDMEIKRQNPWPKIPGMPTGKTTTIVRNNTFIKDDNPSPDGDRPNVLVGGFPKSGLGSDNVYEIYGNFFYHNPREALLQVTGKVSIHDNIFVGGRYAAINVAEHDGYPVRLANIYNNTIYTMGVGICFQSPAEESSTVMGNVVFAMVPITGPITNKSDNLTETPDHAKQYLMNPTFVLGQMSLYPLPGKVQGAPLDLSKFAKDGDYSLDFNGTPKNQASGRPTFRGAYAGEGVDRGWRLQAGVKPEK